MEKDTIAESWDKEAIMFEIEVTPGFLETIDNAIICSGHVFEDRGEFIRSAIRKLISTYAKLYPNRWPSKKSE